MDADPGETDPTGPQHAGASAAGANAAGPGPAGELGPLLGLTLVPELGPRRINRLIDRFGSARAVLDAGRAALEQTKGIGPATAEHIVAARSWIDEAIARELSLADSLGVTIIPAWSPGYPALLRAIPDPPPLIYVRGRIDPAADRYPVAIVGSRECSHYGVDQAGRFAGVLAGAGLTVVSGGARGIDTAAHHGAIRSGGRTIAVMGCGLATIYPPENEPLFRRLVDEDRGAVVSELPLPSPPESKNFPARNRIIAGVALGVLVIEAGARSGALITARIAVDEHGREAMALPGRVDSEASRGTHELIKSGSAALVTEPGDVLAQLEAAARHHFGGTFESRYGPLFGAEPADDGGSEAPEVESRAPQSKATRADSAPVSTGRAGPALTPEAEKLLSALAGPRSIDELTRLTGLDPGRLRAELTILEVQGRVQRRGSSFARRD